MSSSVSPRHRRFLQKYGPWALVTGASEGIGRELALRIAERGLNVVLVARRRELLEDVATEIGERFGRQARVLTADLGKAEEVESVAHQTRDLDIGLLAACAGFGTSGPLVEGSLAAELDMISVNCSAVLGLTHELSRRFVARGKGGIVLMGSIVGFQGVPRAANYAATKAYVQTLAEGLRLELAPHDIDVLSSAPGPVASGFAARADMQMGNALSPQQLGDETLDALGRRTTVRPGWLSKVLGYSLATLPRAGRTRIMALVMGGMTQHQDDADSASLANRRSNGAGSQA